MPSVVNTQISQILNNESGGFPDGTVGQYGANVALPTIAAAGTTQTTGTAVTTQGQLVNVTAASGTNGVTLPVSQAGTEFLIYSSAATNALLVYPPLTGAINNGTVNTSLSVTARKLARFVALDNVGNYAAALSA